MKTTDRRKPILATDQYGRRYLKVPLDDAHSAFALIDETGLEQVRTAGALGALFTNSNGKAANVARQYVRAAITSGKGGTLVQVARLVTGAQPGEVVRYANGDTLDLRADNLRVMRGMSKRCDVSLAGSLRGRLES